MSKATRAPRRKPQLKWAVMDRAGDLDCVGPSREGARLHAWLYKGTVVRVRLVVVGKRK